MIESLPGRTRTFLADSSGAASTLPSAVTFLSPWTALVAAAIALPLFIALYILRLRRQRQVIASTFLWRQATRDLEVNAPIRRLRTSLLFLVQLLLLSALIGAIGEPALRGEGDLPERLVILIDRSASMNAALGEATRLDHAKARAREIIENMSDRREQRMAAILTFGATAEVVQGFATSRGVLVDAIESIESTDEEADFAAALDLAGSFTASTDETAASTELVIISDGGVARAGEEPAAKVNAGSVRFVQAAGRNTDDSAPQNLGFVALSARRDADNPATCIVFARLISTFGEDVAIAITLRRGSEVEDVRSLTVPAATSDGPGEASLTFTMDVPDGALVTLAHDQRDLLASDDQVSLVIAAPRQPRIALVHDGEAPDPYVLQLLEALEPELLRVMTFEAYEQVPPGEIDAARRFDLLVFDRVDGFPLPGVPTITFGGSPATISRHASDENQGQRVLSWDRQHPLMRHVSLDTLVFAGVESLELPAEAEAVARGRSGTIIATLSSNGARHVVVGFALSRSNWPRELSIALFMQNALEHLWLGRSSEAGLVFLPGEPINLRPLPDRASLTIDGPITAEVPIEPNEPAILPSLRRAGIYSVAGAAPPMNVVAVSTLSDLESDIRMRDQIMVNAQPAAAGAVTDIAPQPIWMWVLLAALVILVGEWFLFLALNRV